MDREKVIKEFEHLLNAAKGNYQDFVDLTIDGGEEILARIKEQEGETIECKMCGHRLHKDWVWCPWCRWETARQEGRCYGDE